MTTWAYNIRHFTGGMEMKKNIRRIAALALSLIMALGMSAQVFAGDGGSFAVEDKATPEEAEEQLAEALRLKNLAEGEKQSALERWNGEKEAAQDALTEAQERFDRIGVNFLNEKAGSECSDTVWLSWLRENMSGKTSGNIVWDEVLDTEGFEESFYSPYSYENLMRAADLVDEANLLRKSDDPSNGDLKISYRIMTQAIGSNALSNYVVDHILLHQNAYKSSDLYYACGSAGWENISWGSTDPFMGWYYREKIHYIADQAGEENVTAEMAQQVIDEAQRNGHDFLAYCSMYGYGSNASKIAETLNKDRPSGNYSTGHYTNLVKSSLQSTGLSVNSEGHIYYGVCHVQDFTTSALSDAVTPQEFREELSDYAESAETFLRSAEARVNELKTAPSYYKEASDAFDKAEADYNSAKAIRDSFYDVQYFDVSEVPDAEYTGEAFTPDVSVFRKGSHAELIKDTDYTVEYKNNVNAGTARIVITGAGSYTGTKTVTFNIAKTDNGLRASGKTVKLRASALRKKAQVIKRSEAVTVRGADGTVTYKKVSVSKKKFTKKFKVSTAGKITAAKGLKKGKYKIVILVKAAGDTNHNAASEKVTVTVNVK